MKPTFRTPSDLFHRSFGKHKKSGYQNRKDESPSVEFVLKVEERLAHHDVPEDFYFDKN